jgi:hypothetical protein
VCPLRFLDKRVCHRVEDDAQVGHRFGWFTAFLVRQLRCPEFPDSAAAPYGSSLQVTGPNRVAVAVAERTLTGRQTIVVSQSTDGGRTFGVPRIVAAGRTAPLELPGMSAVSLSSPVLTSSKAGAFALSWTERGAFDGSVPRFAVSSPTGQGQGVSAVRWRLLDSPTLPPGASSLAPAVAFDGTALMATIAVRNGGVMSFEVYRWEAGAVTWAPVVTLGTGVVAQYREVGEFLGMASAAGVVVAAAPLVQGSGGASMHISTLTPLRALPTPSASVHSIPTPSAAGQGSPWARWVPGMGMLLVLFAIVTWIARARVLPRRAQRRSLVVRH